MRMMIKIVDIGASFLGLNDSSKVPFVLRIVTWPSTESVEQRRYQGLSSMCPNENWFPAAFFNLLTLEEDDIGPRTFEIKIGGSFPAAHIVTNLTKEENFVRSYRLIRSLGKAYPDNSFRL